MKMPRLTLGYDTEQFLNHCRMTKPPYECPHASCGRVYRSFAGIQNHLNSFDHENPPPNIGTPKLGSYESDPLPIPMSTNLKMVEFELDGKLTNISVYDPIEIITKELYEASLPPPLEEPMQEIPKTPSLKFQGKHLTPKTLKNRSKDKDRGVDVQCYTIEEKKTQKLPEASFRLIPGYYENLPDAPVMPDTYFRFVEKSSEEHDEEVEYDMDEEDRAWLYLINQRRLREQLDEVSMENFELLMDRLEKESFFQAQSTGREHGAPIDEDAVCCICMDGECQNSNVILFCDMCNLAVHQECYGVPYIPEGQWLCRRCLQSPSRAVDCALCPNKGGAFKQTDDGRWAHVVCAMWIPEVCFANTVFLEPIDSIGNIPPARWKLTCYICVQRGVGACIQCNKVNCYTAFHVTCAQQAGLHMKIDAIRETNASGTSVTVRKAAYCDMHTPADSDARPQVEELMDAAKKAAAKAASRQKMKKARKILAEKRSAAPIVSVPTLPAESRISPFCWGIVNSLPVPPYEKIQQLAKLVQIEKRAIFIHRLLAFWTLKRQSRNGVPLLRRLTSSYARKNNNNNINVQTIPTSPPIKREPLSEPKKIQERIQRTPPPVTVVTAEEKFSDEIQYWQRLRQDLERARLLCELIRKREKMKRELVKAMAEERSVQLAPFVHLLLQKIDQIQEKDIQQIFAEPVDFEEVPDYLDVVKHPMDLSTMRQKAQAHQYQNVDQFTADFELMIDNCLTYNSRDTIFYRAAVRLRDQGGAIIRQLVRDVETIGYDPEAGLLLHRRPKPQPELSEEEIIKEIDKVTSTDLDEGETFETRKVRLLYLMDKANLIKHNVTRLKKLKLLRRGIGIIRRKLSWSESGGGGGGGSKHLTDTYESDNSDMEDTDKDDSSVIDDEAEPGVPSRPSSPQLASVSPKLPSVPHVGSELCGVSEHPKRRLSLENNTSTIKKSKTFIPVIEAKQRKIDSYFTKTENLQEKKEDKKPEEENIHQPSKKVSETVAATVLPRKRGRPPKHSLAAVGMLGSSEVPQQPPAPSPAVPSQLPEQPVAEEISKQPNAVETSKGTSEELPKENNTVVVSEPSSPSPENKKSSALFTKKPGELFKKPSIEESTLKPTEEETLLKLPVEATLTKESFKVYRQGGEISQETDEDTQSESNSSLTDSEDESQSESGSDDGASDTESSTGGGDVGSGSLQGSGEQIPLEPLDLVWAKCRGYPWYPALIINPKMPRTGYFHNHVPIPVPPDEVLAHATNYHTPMYLILFFDQKRTWQWLPRNKLEPLGVNSALDKAKLVESRKPAERKAVKKAYEKAILHRCRVTGENTGLSGESDNETHP